VTHQGKAKSRAIINRLESPRFEKNRRIGPENRHDVTVQKRNRDFNQLTGSIGRLVVVSNRVADPRRDRKAGGLAVAVGETLAATGGVWFGWSGNVRSDAAEVKPVVRNIDGIHIITIDLTEAELSGFYQGYANQCLWPLLHYRMDLVQFEREYLAQYRAVNRRFATALTQFLGPDDIIWIHDLHLLPLGKELRRLGCKQPIGFFLHVPFPPSEVVAALPGHADLMRDLLAYDLVGFQTQYDLACFRSYARKELGARLLEDGLLEAPSGHVVACGAFPVGIDVDMFVALTKTAEARREFAHLRKSVGDRDLVVGVDRLDYSKGLTRRLAAYRRFLSSYPENHNKVVLLQVTPPSRETVESYAIMKRELERLEGAINGEYAEFDWTPVRCLRRAVSRTKLAALYRASRVGLVTPLRDGMNLVAKEYVAAQDEDDPGVLILSKFAGAAEAMDQALIVNPYDKDQVAEALQAAIKMSLEERQARHQSLLTTIRTQDVHAWSKSFLSRLADCKPPSGGDLSATIRSDAPVRPAVRKRGAAKETG
jgi:trehalose 6-phosphate synthase